MWRTDEIRWCLAVAAVFAPTAAPACIYDIKPGRLGDVAAAIGQCAGITVTVPDPVVAARRSPGVRGSMPVRSAIARALAGTKARAVFASADVVRITSRPPEFVPPPVPAPVRAIASATPPEAPSREIVVTASKQRLRLLEFPGSVKLLDIEPAWVGRNAADGTAAIVRSLPALQATDLGQGRDKLFIRGIADSSFRGQTQAATGQYLGDVRLTFNAPDPSLNLYDMERVEVLVGPQAPLYGAGSLGGVIRLVPNAPAPSTVAATASINVSTTRFGGTGNDIAAMLNVPIVDRRLTARLVFFDAVRAGYIDATRQGRKDINRARSGGHRFTLRATPSSDWTIDVSDVLQNLHSRDGQYTTVGGPDLTRDAPIAEPFGSDYRLRYVTAMHDGGSTQLVTTTARVDHSLSSVFDASGIFGAGAIFRERNAIGIWSHETRLSRSSPSSRWLIGASAIHSVSDVEAMLQTAADSNTVSLQNRNFDAALFGSYAKPLSHDVTLTAGGRLSFTQTIGRVVASQTLGRTSRDGLRFSRVLALNWQASNAASAYVRHEQGYRAGGLSVFPDQDRVVSEEYRPDTLTLYEVGARVGRSGPGKVTARAAVFYADWADVQADIATFLGVTLTANVGHGRVAGLDAEVLWKATGGLSLKGDVFINDGRLTISNEPQIPLNARRLPSVAAAGGRLSLDWVGNASPDQPLRAGASLRYVGRSRLGVGEALNIPQGNYLVADASTSIDLGRFTGAIKVDNLFDRRGNTFAFGNPFTVVFRNQATPLRPRTLTIGVDARF